MAKYTPAMKANKICTQCKENKPANEYYIRKKRGVEMLTTRCKQCFLEYCQKWRHILKSEVFGAYGGKCACCNETNLKLLTMDHINGDGKQERQNGFAGSTTLWRHLRKLGYPKDRYQILCWNCNIGKFRYGQCPHKEAPDS